jgi:hypothetical protein
MSLEVKANPNQAVEAARQELIDWWGVDGNALCEGDSYKEVAARVTEAAKDLQRVDMALYRHHFRFGFSFYYGEKPNVKQLVALPPRDARIISVQFEHDPENACWPIKDPKTDTYYVPHITNKESVPPPSGSTPTNQYLYTTIRSAEYGDQKARRILEVLHPYANTIKEYDKSIYNKIPRFFPKEFRKEEIPLERERFEDLESCRNQ